LNDKSYARNPRHCSGIISVYITIQKGDMESAWNNQIINSKKEGIITS
jgi:hypothetical protein